MYIISLKLYKCYIFDVLHWFVYKKCGWPWYCKDKKVKEDPKHMCWSQIYVHSNPITKCDGNFWAYRLGFNTCLFTKEMSGSTDRVEMEMHGNPMVNCGYTYELSCPDAFILLQYWIFRNADQVA